MLPQAATTDRTVVNFNAKDEQENTEYRDGGFSRQFRDEEHEPDEEKLDRGENGKEEKVVGESNRFTSIEN